jgi:MFS family permease
LSEVFGSSRDIVLLLTSLIVGTVPVGYLLVVLPLYLNRAGLEPALIGFLYSLSGLVTAVLVAFSGFLADRFGRRVFLVWGTALPIVSYAVFAFTTEPAWLVLASLIGGVGLASGAAGALTAASFDALLAEHTPPRQRTTVFAWSQAVWALALGLGSFAAGLPELLRSQFGIAELDAYRPPFVLIIVLAVVATFALLPIGERASTISLEKVERTGWFPRRSLGVIVRYGLSIGLFGMGLGIAVQLLPLWFKLRFGTDEAILGPWYAVAQVVSLTSVVVSPWLDRQFGSGLAIMLVHIGGALSLLAMAVVAPVFEVAAIAFVFRNSLANFGWPLQQALLMGRVVPEERATAAGVGFAVWGLANAIGPSIAGLLIQSGTLALPLILGAVAYAGGGVGFGLGFRRR